MYSKKYLKEYDKTHEFIPLTRDYLFKAIMLKNIEIFKRFLINTLHLDLDPKTCDMVFLSQELIKENVKEHNKIVDLNIKLGKDILINMELNNNDFKIVKRRNELYIEKLDTLAFEMGDRYSELNNKKLYQLNLNTKEDEDCGEEVILFYNQTKQEVFDDRLMLIIKHLRYYKRRYQEGYKLNEDEIFMASLMSKNYEELYDIMGNILTKEELEKYMESVMMMNMENFVLHEWEKEKFDKMIEENIKKDAEEKGMAKGIEQNKTDMIKAMLESNLSYEIISKVSGKTIDEIKEIEKSLKD